MKKALAILLFSFVISIPVVIPFFHAGYFPTHDGEWAVVRLGDMFRTLRDFQIPARYSGNLNFGYGYPLFNFAYPFPYYLGVILHFLGFGFVNSIKLIFAGSVLLSALFMFLASRLLWKNVWAGVVSAILYIYFPYRMVDLYVRGSIGESLSFALFPLLLYFAFKLIIRSSRLLISGIAISVAALIMTHNIITVFFLPLYFAFILFYAFLKNKKIIKTFLVSILLGLGLSAFFWIPAILEKNNILLSQIPIADRSLYFVDFKQLIFPGWGYGVPTAADGFSYQLGVVHLIMASIAILFFCYSLIKTTGRLKDFNLRILGALIIFMIFYFFLLFKQSKLLWKMPLLSEINYPWIVLGILGLLISLSAGFFTRYSFGKYLLIILSIIAAITVMPYARPQYYIDKGDNYYLTNEATTTSSSELMPLWVEKMPLQRAGKKIEIISGNGKIENIFFNSKQITFSVDALSQSLVRINTIYYPGWKVNIDNANAPISYSNEKGVMDISVPSGKHIIDAQFKETNLRLISDLISIASFSTLLFLRIKGLRKPLPV